MPGMSIAPINITIDRHASGNTRIHGTVGANRHDVNVWKGPTEGDSYVEGRQNGEPTTLRINSYFSDNGHGVLGRVAGVPFKGELTRAADGDLGLTLNKANLTLDVTGSELSSAGTRIKSTGSVTNAEGDETLTLLADGRQVKLTVDRQADGDIELRGTSGDGPFRCTMERSGVQGDLRVKGTLPESLGLLPVMWELYGNDSVQPPAQPITMGAAATLSAFWGTHL